MAIKKKDTHARAAGHVARVIKKYYKRIGNRDVFRNGMSTAELVKAMDPFAELGVSKEALTRIKKADRIITPEQSQAFCKAVGLSTEEHLLFESARLKDELCSKGMDLAVVALAPTINLLIRDLQLTNKAVSEDKLVQALLTLSNVFRWKDDMGKEAFDSPYLIRVHTFMSIEREKLIQKITQQDDSLDLSNLEFVNLSPIVDVVGESDATTHLQLIQSIHMPTVTLTAREQQIWNGIYQNKQTLSEIAASLFLQPGTVQSIRESIEGRIMTELTRQLNVAEYLS